MSCDQIFDWGNVDDHRDSRSHAGSGDEELPPHGIVDSLSEKEVDKKRFAPQKRKSRKARLAIARALQPACDVVEIAKLKQEINEVDDNSEIEPIMCPFDNVVEEVDERKPHEYAYRTEKPVECGIDDVEPLPSASCVSKQNIETQDQVCSLCPRCCWR